VTKVMITLVQLWAKAKRMPNLVHRQRPRFAASRVVSRCRRTPNLPLKMPGEAMPRRPMARGRKVRIHLPLCTCSISVRPSSVVPASC
jgi:hypothetical protein